MIKLPRSDYRDGTDNLLVVLVTCLWSIYRSITNLFCPAYEHVAKSVSRLFLCRARSSPLKPIHVSRQAAQAGWLAPHWRTRGYVTLKQYRPLAHVSLCRDLCSSENYPVGTIHLLLDETIYVMRWLMVGGIKSQDKLSGKWHFYRIMYSAPGACTDTFKHYIKVNCDHKSSDPIWYPLGFCYIRSHQKLKTHSTMHTSRQPYNN